MRIRAIILTVSATLAPLAAQEVGTEAAEITWRKTHNFERMPTEKLSQLRGSVVLLEFWGTH